MAVFEMPFVIFSVLGWAMLDVDQQDDDASDVIVARQEMLQSIEVTFTTERHFTPPQWAVKNDRKEGAKEGFAATVGSRRETASFRFLRGRAYYERRSTSQEEEPPSEAESSKESTRESAATFRYWIRSHLEDRTEQAWQQVNERRDRGRITNPEEPPEDAIIDLALGLRVHYMENEFQNRFLPPEDWLKFERHRSEDGTVVVVHPSESAEPDAYRRDVWTFDPQHGFALTKYEVFAAGQVCQQIENSDFRAVDGVHVPHRVKYRAFSDDGSGGRHQTQSVDLVVSEYHIGSPDNTPDSYYITWPDGAVVLDGRTGQQIVVRGGPQKLNDERLKEYYAKGSQWLEHEGDSGGLRFWMIVGNLVIFVLVVCGVIFCRYRRRAY